MLDPQYIWGSISDRYGAAHGKVLTLRHVNGSKNAKISKSKYFGTNFDQTFLELHKSDFV